MTYYPATPSCTVCGAATDNVFKMEHVCLADVRWFKMYTTLIGLKRKLFIEVTRSKLVGYVYLERELHLWRENSPFSDVVARATDKMRKSE